MELDQPPNMVNVLVFHDHFTKHFMAYMTPNQTAKTLAKFRWQSYISIFGVLAKLLSDRGANFESNIIRELCKLMGIRKVRTSSYHAQSNGQVEQAHQTLMWPKHLPDLVHAYNTIGHHQIQPTLFDVKVMTALTHQLLFPHNKGHE